MKTTNIALHAVLAVIGTASRASAKGFFRGGSVEKKEDVRRGTMGDQVSHTYLDTCAEDGVPVNCKTCGDLIEAHPAMTDSVSELLEAGKGIAKIDSNKGYMEACYAVAKDYERCLGCQGYELEATNEKQALTGSAAGMVHIPGCLNLSTGDCIVYAREILANHPEWFPENLATFIADTRQVTSEHEQWYWLLGLPVKGGSSTGAYLNGATPDAMSQRVQGLAGEGDCMVHYPYLWCTEINTGVGSPETQCQQLAPFDCSGINKECLTAGECCEKINGVEGEGGIDALYVWPDINGNKLQCYAWPIDTPASGGQTGTRPTGPGNGGTRGPSGSSELRLIMHTNNMRVVLPAIITARKDFILEGDRGITTVFDEDNINTWEQDFDNLDEYMKNRGRGIPKFNEATEMKMGSQLDKAQANNDVWEQDAAEGVTAGSGYYAGAGTPGGGQAPGGGVSPN